MVKKIKTVSVSPAMPLSKFSLLKRRQCGVRFFLHRTQCSLFKGVIWKLHLQTFAGSLGKYNSIFTFPQGRS